MRSDRDQMGFHGELSILSPMIRTELPKEL